MEGKKEILVVDDNPVILKLFSEFLKREGHDVICTEDVFACLEYLSTTIPDIIFLDLVMPKINGEDLCRIIRSMETLATCYIVIVSAIALEEQTDFREMGANACIAKGPFRDMQEHILQQIANVDCPTPAQETGIIQGSTGMRSRQITVELLQQNRHLRVILESISQGVVEIEQHRVVYVNPPVMDLLGDKKEKLLGAYVTDVFPKILRDAIKLQSTESPFDSRSTPTVIFDDKQIMVESYLLSNGKSQVVLLTDVTERKQMESVIIAANLTENLGYIFSGIRHEIGNPVNSIKMALSVLLKNIAIYDQSTVTDFITRSLDEVARIEYLLTALKNYSLFESPITEEISLPKFFANFIQLIQDDFKQQNIDLQTVFGSEDLTVVADTRALHQVMLNLVTNAADAIESKPGARIKFNAIKNQGYVEIKVEDNGKGISPSDQNNLFKPFFTSKAKGTGLGLVIVQKMLQAMNGRIAIESSVETGTTVTVSLPGA